MGLESGYISLCRDPASPFTAILARTDFLFRHVFDVQQVLRTSIDAIEREYDAR